jgi:amidase
MDAIATTSASDLAAAIKARDLSSRELLAAYLDRIERLNAPVNAVVTLAVERAQEEAAAADVATARNQPLGPLHGLPITIKDAIETAGIRSTGGAVELTDHVPAVDAPAVAKLRAAGAVVFGKTNLPRWSGDLQSYNEIFGTTNNPWDRSRVPGGSSGGAATAVACGFTSFELGTDIGGSVRNPSHCCGVFGLKPSYGVVPQRGYLDHVGGGTTDADINVFGPIARSADDLDLLLGVLAGPPPEQEPAWRIELPKPPGRRTLSGKRIALWLDDPACRIDKSYHVVLTKTADALEAAGAKVEEAHPPVDFVEQVGLFTALITEAITPSMPEEIAQAFSASHAAWLAKQKERAAMQRVWATWFEGWDALLCPVIPTPAFPHNQEGDMFSRTMTINGETRSYLDNVAWAGLIGITGLPAAVPPLAHTADGLPVGVQVVTPYLQDRAAVQLAGLIAEAASGGYRTPPGF